MTYTRFKRLWAKAFPPDHPSHFPGPGKLVDNGTPIVNEELIALSEGRPTPRLDRARAIRRDVHKGDAHP